MANNRMTGGMALSDLKIGQKLIEVNRGHWSYNVHTESMWRVVRTTSTRLIINLIREVGGVDIPTEIEYRVLVRDGKVTTKIEGRGSKDIELHTLDSEELPELRAATARSKIRSDAQKFAENAHRRLSGETARAAITALQAYLDAYSATDDE